MTKLRFNAQKVIKLIEATENAKMLDNTKPALLFVKDEGIYLMSNRKYAEGETPRNTGELVYAKGYGENASYDKIVGAVGGDDFGERFPLSDGWATDIPAKPIDMVIEVSETQLSIGWEFYA